MASKRVGYQQIKNHIEKFVDCLSFLKYHLNNRNAKENFKCLFFIYNLMKILSNKSFNSYRARRLW